MRLRCSSEGGQVLEHPGRGAARAEAPAVSRCRAAVGELLAGTTAGSASSHRRCCAGRPARGSWCRSRPSAARSVSASSVCSTRSCGRTRAGRPTADHGTGQAEGFARPGPRVGVGAASADRPLWNGIRVEPHAAGEGGPGSPCGCGRRRGRPHVAAVVLVGHPERDPQVGVGADLRGDHAAGPLGRQDQVDAQRPAALGDADRSPARSRAARRRARRTRR